jgi:superfamily II DNA or RNA helicase/predicted RNA methylase
MVKKTEVEILREKLRKIENELASIKKTKPLKKTKLKKSEIESLRIENLPSRKVGLPTDVSSKKLQKHQIEFVKNFIDGYPRGAIAIHGVGSGKTLTAVITAETYLQKFPKSKVVVITPASLLAGFKEELYTYDPAIESDSRYSFFTYDAFNNAVKRGDKLADCSDALMIVDEAQNLRTSIRIREETRINDHGDLEVLQKIKSGAKVLTIIAKCSNIAKKILLLSATPLVNSIIDIENLMAMINGHEPLDSNSSFFNKIIANPKLMARYFGCRLSFFEHDQKSRALYFPKMQEMYVPIVMNTETLSKFNSIESETPSDSLRNELRIKPESKKINSFFTGMRKASNAIGGDHSQKVNFIMNWLSGVRDKKPNTSIKLTKKILGSHTNKTVIFTHYKDTGTNLIVKRLTEGGFKFGVVNGSVSKLNRAKIVQSYVKGEISTILISKAGAEGLNLLETGYIIIMEPSWNNTEQSQVKGRGVRFRSHANLPMSKRNVLVLDLFLIKPSEETLFVNMVKEVENPKIEKDKKNNSFTALHNASIDLKMFGYSNLKQIDINNYLKTLKTIDSVEHCKYTKDFLDITTLFKVERDVKIPKLSSWEEQFYSQMSKDKPPKRKKDKNTDLTMRDLKRDMITMTRKLFGGRKEFIQLQNAFFTPPSIARDMVEFSGINKASKDIVFLEPSAGAGFIIYEALVSNNKIFATAIENIKNLQTFLKTFPRTNVLPIDNFFNLDISKKFKVILMNPPYTLKKGMGLEKRVSHDVDFVLKAFDHLENNGILVALITSKYEFRGLNASRKTDAKIFDPFRELLANNEHIIVKYEDGFTKATGAVLKEMHTGVDLRMIKILKKEKK